MNAPVNQEEQNTQPEQNRRDSIIKYEEQLHSLSERELYDKIMAAGTTWDESQNELVAKAYRSGTELHAGVKHGDKPYITHPLRNANRLIDIFGVTDPEEISAAILHDTVEDCADKILADANIPVPDDARLKQQLALAEYAKYFSQGTADIVAGMTNDPSAEDSPMGDEEVLDHYAQHVAAAIDGDTRVARNKFVDTLGDNGFNPPKEWWKQKYGRMVPVFEERFRRPDMQAELSPEALANVEAYFAITRENLMVPQAEQDLGDVAVSHV